LLSTVLELAGFASLAAGAFMLAGLVALLLVAGVEFLILGLAFDSTLVARPRVKRK
jgi:hypothetical protein